MKDTKQHIIKTAFNLFLQHSYKEVTMKQIVEKSELSKGAFYHYFSSKEELFNEILNAFFDLGKIDYTKFNHDSLYNFYIEYLELWQKTVPLMMDEFGVRNQDFNFFVLMFDALKIFPEFVTKTKNIHKIELDAWTKIIKIAREKGEIKSPMSDEMIAYIFVYFPEGLYLHRILDGTIDQVSVEMKEFFDSL